MKEFKGKIFLIAAIVLLVGQAEKIFAQTLTEAIEAFNSGAEAINSGETESAIESLENCIKICEEVGPEADERKLEAQRLLPNLYYGIAMDAYKEKQFDKAIKGLEKTIEVSKKYEDPGTEEKANSNMPKLYYAQGLNAYKQKDYVNAKPKFKKAIELDPEYINAYFTLAIAEKNSGNEEEMVSNLDKVIEIGPANNSTVKKAIQTNYSHYQNTGKKAINSKDYKTAAEALETSFKYKDEDSDTYYYITMSYNNLENWDKAIESGLKAVELTTGGEEALAKANYELAKAYEGKGDKEKACATYTKAAVGKYAESAKYQMEHVLKCGEQ